MKGMKGGRKQIEYLGGFGLKYSFIWKPYDPNNFITMRRLKYKLSAYGHYSLPHIEKYANQSKWKRGTLEENVTQEELNQRALNNQKKMADLEFYSQVPSLPSTQIGAAASSSTTPQQTTRVAGKISEKGKEKEMEAEKEMEQEQQQEQQQKQQQHSKQKGCSKGSKKNQDSKSNNRRRTRAGAACPAKENSGDSSDH
jgi:hypothetical protein